MRIKDFIAAMERIAPPPLAAEWDNVGLIVGTEQEEIRNVLVALDCTTAVADEARERGCELVLTHHPLLFHGVRRLMPNDPDTAAVFRLIKNGVGLYSAHTNLDAAEGGVNDALAELFGLCDRTPFFEGMGRVGTLPKAVTLGALAERTDGLLKTVSRYTGDADTRIRTLAVLGGAGGDAIAAAREAGADALITGEIKHHEALNANELGIPVIVAGHHETEAVVLKPLIRRLQSATNDVQYYIAHNGVAPFVRQKNPEVEP